MISIVTNTKGTIRNLATKKAIDFINNPDETFSPASNNGKTYINGTIFLCYASPMPPEGGYNTRWFTTTKLYNFKKFKRLKIKGTVGPSGGRLDKLAYIQVLQKNGGLYQRLLQVNTSSSTHTISIDLDISNWKFEGRIAIGGYNYTGSQGGAGYGGNNFSFSEFSLT